MKNFLKKHTAVAQKLPMLLMIAFCLITFNDKSLALMAACIGWSMLVVFWPVPKTAR